MNKKDMQDFLLYFAVGGISTLFEWGTFYVLNRIFCRYYLESAIVSYILSTFVNWLVGKIILFKEATNSVIREITGIYAASIIGLLLNLAIMWIMVDILFISSIVSKVVATGLVFAWNFLIRKMVIYKGKNNEKFNFE